MDAEKKLRDLLKAKADEMPSAPIIPVAVLRRSRIRRSVSASLATAVLIAASIGILAGVKSIVEGPSLDPVHPAPSVIERPEPTVELYRDVSKVTGSERCSVASSGDRERRSPTPDGESTRVQAPLGLTMGPAEMLLFFLGASVTSTESGCVIERSGLAPAKSRDHAEGPKQRPRAGKNK